MDLILPQMSIFDDPQMLRAQRWSVITDLNCIMSKYYIAAPKPLMHEMETIEEHVQKAG